MVIPARGRLRAALVAAAIGWMLSGSPRGADPTQGGALRGTVLDRDFGVPLAQVRVAIVEVSLATLTGDDGAFLLERVPPGIYTVSFAKDGFERAVVAGVAISPGELSEVRAELTAEIVEMEEMVVDAGELLLGGEAGTLEVRAEAVGVQDAISSEIISRAGASDVAGALKMVVGASVAGGKYATVRGLSDRYTGTTVNGVRVPSADPRRRAVQVDLFPTGTIDGLTVTKTFTPDLRGDFTGGGVDIRTKAVPEGKLLAVSFGLEYNSAASWRSDFLTYTGGGVDSLGRDPASRDLPAAALTPLPQFPRYGFNPPPAELEKAQAYDTLVRSFQPVMGVSEGDAGTNHSLNLVAGNRIERAGGRVLGALFSLTYAHKYDFYENAANNSGSVSDASQGIALQKKRNDTRGTDELLQGGLASVLFQPTKGHELSFQVFMNQSAEDEARYQFHDRGLPSIEQNQTLQYTKRKVSSAQLDGHHALAGLELHWSGAYNETSQEEPDVRFFRNLFNLDDFVASKVDNTTESQTTRRIFRNIGENNRQGAFDATFPFTQWSESAGSLKGGVVLDRTDRDYDQHSYYYIFSSQFGPPSSADVQANNALATYVGTGPDSLWTDVFTNPDRVGLAGNTPPAPNQLLWYIVPLAQDVNYDAEQVLDGIYAMGDLPLTPELRVIGGARREMTEMSVDPFNPARGRVEMIEVQEGGDRAIVSVPQSEAAVRIDEAAWLPSLGIVWEAATAMNVRATWSRTIARPTFRELAPVAAEEFLAGDEFTGNPELRLSEIANYDLRWEWFPSSGRVLAASAFYKTIRNPIELISFSAGGRTFIQPLNYELGRIHGFEVEARSDLAFFGGSWRELSVGANATKIDSEVDVPLSEQDSLDDYGLAEERRRLQGQPGYLVNFNVTWDEVRHGISAALFYNLVGETLATGAARNDTGDGTPNVFERSYATLDASFGKKLGDQWSVSVKAKNLLQADRTTVYRTPAGEEAIKTERQTPLLFGVSAAVKW